MTRHRGLSFACALIAAVALTTSEARAGDLTVVLSWTGHTLTITGTPFATLTTTASGESLTFNNTPLNAFLEANGSAIQFGSGSGVSDNQPVATNASGAFLTSNGQVSVDQSNPGSTAMTIDAFKTDWNTPSGATGTLVNSGSATFGHTVAGDTTTYNSWYNNDNSPDGKLLGAGLQTYTSTGAPTESPIGVPPNSTTAGISPFVTPFSLTNETVITLTKSGSNAETANYQLQTTVSTSVIPEPASVVIVVSALPLLALGLRRRAAVRG